MILHKPMALLAMTRIYLNRRECKNCRIRVKEGGESRVYHDLVVTRHGY